MKNFRIWTSITLIILLVFSLFPGFAGNHSITVDGNPSDWVGSAPTSENSGAYDQGEYIWRDAENDDAGNGSYIYPTGVAYDTFPEDDQVYDLLEWRVTNDLDKVYFLFRVANVTNPWNGPNGFSHQLPIILIDQDRVQGSGRTDVIREANCRVSDNAAWEFAIWASGWHIGAEDAAGNAYEDFSDAVVAGNTSTDCIEMGIPISFLGDPSGETWRFTVILGPEEYQHCRRVDANVSTNCIGGGEGNSTYIGNDPNFLDLAFYNSTEEQEAELGEFSTTGSLVVLNGYKDITFSGQPFGGNISVIGLDALMNDSSDRFATFNVTVSINASDPLSYAVDLSVSQVSPGTGYLGDFNYTFSENGFSLSSGQSKVAVLTLEYLGIISNMCLPSGTHSVQVVAHFTTGSSHKYRGDWGDFDVISPVPPLDGAIRQIDVIFLFHFNQDLVPYGDQANDACYVGLLKTLRKHPNSKFAIHISGTLMEDMQWFNNTALQLVRDGVVDGQFEVIGSTYSQNIMYSTNMTDNDQQIKEHREIIEKIFGVSPKGFWNPERTWNQSFVPLLVDNGYEYTQVEDYILDRSGIAGSRYLVRTTTLNGKQLVIFTDDQTFMGIGDSTIDSGNSGNMISFLQDRYNEDTDDQFAVCYHQDAEATGLWDYEHLEDPHVDWNNLDDILTDLENEPWIKITTYEEFLKNHSSAEDVSPIVDGAATWMGRDDWFDYNANNPGVNAMRALFTQVRNVLMATEQAIQAAKNDGNDTTSAEKLLEHAWTSMIAHQYEFGCYVGHAGHAQMELVRTALVSAEAARYALNPSSTTQITEEDINNDSLIEIVVKNQHNMFVFSRRGGRLIYWFDIDNGEELVGNENFNYYGEGYTDDSTYVPTLKKGDPLWSWLAGNNLIPWDVYKRFMIRRRVLNDFLKINGAYLGGSNFTLVNANYAYSLSGNNITFTYSDDQVNIQKRVTIPSDGKNVDVTYSITYKGGGFANLELEVENGLCPSYEMVMEAGKDILQYWKDGEVISESELPTSGTVGVVNVESGALVSLVLVNFTVAMGGDNGCRYCHNVFAKSLIPKFAMGLNSGEKALITFSLESSRISTDPEFFKGARQESGKIIVEVPTYVRKVTLRYEQDGEVVNETMKYHGAHEVSAPLPQGWYQIFGEDIYGNTKGFVAANGTASFSMLNGALDIYHVHLECDLDIFQGNHLLVVFYSWTGNYRGNATVWSDVSPINLSLSVNVSSPQEEPVMKVELVLTDGGKAVLSLASFMVTRSVLMDRLTQLDKEWLSSSPEERSTIMLEIVEIDGLWPYAPFFL